jgi:hypothetical protein
MPRTITKGSTMHRSSVLLIVGLLISWTWPGIVRPDDVDRSVPEKARVERLARLAKLWGTVRYLHPFLAYRDLDWDAPLIKAIPKMEAAKTRDEYAAAITEMLAALGDPATTVVVAGDQQSNPGSGEAQPFSSWVDGEILIVRITDYLKLERDYQSMRSKLEGLQSDLGKAKGIVFDLRAITPGTQPGMITSLFEPVEKRLVARELVGPAERFLLHSGYTPQSGATSGGYYSAFVTSSATKWLPGPGAKDRRVAFVVNARSELPPVALALQGAGRGAVIAEGPISEGIFVTTTQVDLGEGLMARVRLSEYVGGPGGPDAIRADVQVTPSPDSGPTIPSYDSALNFVRGKLEIAKPARNPGPSPVVVQRIDKNYRENAYPAREYRLLAGFRLWNVISYFFAYRHLIGEDWDVVLTEFIPKLEAARDAREYAQTLAEMAAHTHDSHVSVRSGALSEFFGTSWPQLELREIEGQVVVTRVGPSNSIKKSGIEWGDVIVKVDGEPVRDRMSRLGRYLSASTPQAHTYMILFRLLAGVPGSTVTLTVRDRHGKESERALIRPALGARLAESDGRPVLQVLDGNIGYADLTRLNVDRVDGMFDRFKDTRAIIFDMRGYPRGTAWAIAPRINTKGAIYAAEFRRPLVGGLPFASGSFYFQQPIPPRSSKSLYGGRTAMLIDERAISQSEHRAVLRGGQRHDLHRQPHDGSERGRHHVDGSRRDRDLIQRARRPPRRRPPAPADRAGAPG